MKVRFLIFLMGSSVLLAFCVAGCGRVPNDVEHFEMRTESVIKYLNGDAEEARAAMLELEHYTLHCQKVGTKGVSYDQVFAGIYSRLYLVEKEMSNDEAARQYYGKAVEAWRSHHKTRGKAAFTPAQMREQIEKVDRLIGVPRWKSEVND